MNVLKSLGSGAIGAAALTLLHETARRFIPTAPRMDVLGMRALTQSFHAADQSPPPHDTLFGLSMAGDLVANSLYYSLIGVGSSRHIWQRGAALGFMAGIGAVVLPGPLGLGSAPSNRTTATQMMTVAWYTVGGLATAAAAQQFDV